MTAGPGSAAPPRCVGEPVSWPRLEAHAAGELGPRARHAIDEHVASCARCRSCLASIREDVVTLPPLVISIAPRRARWWRWVIPPLGLAAAAAIALLMLRPGSSSDAEPSDRVTIKGIGVVELELVRDRAGVVSFDAATFAEGDRWKAVVTCPPAATAHFELFVTEHGSSTVDRPLGSPARLGCGNQVALPGAFALSGNRAHTVCVRIRAEDGGDVACVTLRPEAAMPGSP